MTEWAFLVVLTILLATISIGYYTLLKVLALVKGRKKNIQHFQEDELPRISVIIPLYGHYLNIDVKVHEVFSQYPSDKIQVIVVCSAPTHETLIKVEELKNLYNFDLILERVRSGKSRAINMALSRAKEEICVITDVDTRLADGALESLVANFRNPEVGAVSARIQYYYRDRQDAVYSLLFNKYKSQTKYYEGLIDSCSYAPGELLGFRRSLVQQLPEDAICDDLYICWKVRSMGFHCIEEPKSIAYEEPPLTFKGKLARTRRVVVGTLQEAKRFSFMLFSPKYGVFGLLILPSYLLRIFITPFTLVALALVILQKMFTGFFGAMHFLSTWPLLMAPLASLILIVVKPIRTALMSIIALLTGIFLGIIDYFSGRRPVVWIDAKKV